LSPQPQGLLMNDLLIDLGVVLFFGLIAGMALADLAGSGRLEPSYRLSRPAADLAKSVCVALCLPLFQGLFLFAPFPGGGNSIRTSVEFRVATTALIGAMEVAAIAGTLRAFRRWRRAGSMPKSERDDPT
jgi:hypothetical protein